MKGESRRLLNRHPRQRTVPFLVFALSLAVTFLVASVASRNIESRDKLRLDNELHRVELALLQRVDSQVALLRNTAAMFSTQRDVTPVEFEAYVRNIGLNGRYDGTLGLGYAARVAPEDRRKVEREVRVEGNFPNYRIFPDSKGEAWAIRMLEPRSEANRKAMGYDMGSEPVRRFAMTRARDEGTVSLSGRVKLIQDSSSSSLDSGFLLYCPLYHGGGVPPTREGRRSTFMGTVYSPFRAQDFYEEIFDPNRGLQMWVEIYDGSYARPERLLYRNVPVDAARTAEAIPCPIQVAGRTWLVLCYPQPQFVAGSGEPVVRWIPVGGLIVALLLAGLSFSQVRANEVLLAQAEELRLREFHQSLLARAGEALSATADVDRNLHAVAELAVPTFADWCAVDVLEADGSVRRIAVTHADPTKAELAAVLRTRYSSDPNGTDSISRVIQTGQPAFLPEMTGEMICRGARDEEHARMIESLGFQSAIVVPMAIHDETIGVIIFVGAESGLRYRQEDVAVALQIAGRAAVAVENARLFAAREEEIGVRRAAEAQVRELNENLERLVAERTRELTASNQELEAFCYSVSHDLRSPLRSVDGFSKAILEDYGDRLDAEGRGFVDRVRLAARRMDELITALLALSRLTRTELFIQPVDLSEIARQSGEELRRHDGAGRVEIVIEPGLRTEADPRMVRIALDNLIGNAIKFSSQIEHSKVEIGQVDGAFFVRDNGVGFNPAYANKLFVPFERLHSNGEFPGTGIGLATVQRIIARHGGRVWAHSEEGHGATFYFTLEEESG